jgi:hypothetical protein
VAGDATVKLALLLLLIAILIALSHLPPPRRDTPADDRALSA